MNTRAAECMKIGTRGVLGLGIHFWCQKYPKINLSGCKFRANSTAFICDFFV